MADPARLTALLAPPKADSAEQARLEHARLPRRDRRQYRTLIDRCAHLAEEPRRLLAIRLAELMKYQRSAYAREYLDFVLMVAEHDPAGYGA